MDAREVQIIGTINALPCKLITYPDVELFMTILVVDIPPDYGMLLSRKCSFSMGGSLHCDLSYATFHIGDKATKIEREPRVTYIFGDSIYKDDTYFLDIRVNAFKVEIFIHEIEKIPQLIEQEVTNCVDSQGFWIMLFGGANSKEGSGTGIVFISLEKNTFRYSFTLNFTCTNNVVEYEAFLLGLKVATSYGIKKLHIIGDS